MSWFNRFKSDELRREQLDTDHKTRTQSLAVIVVERTEQNDVRIAQVTAAVHALSTRLGAS